MKYSLTSFLRKKGEQRKKRGGELKDDMERYREKDMADVER
jgi:hypothetical protein